MHKYAIFHLNRRKTFSFAFLFLSVEKAGCGVRILSSTFVIYFQPLWWTWRCLCMFFIESNFWRDFSASFGDNALDCRIFHSEQFSFFDSSNKCWLCNFRLHDSLHLLADVRDKSRKIIHFNLRKKNGKRSSSKSKYVY